MAVEQQINQMVLVPFAQIQELAEQLKTLNAEVKKIGTCQNAKNEVYSIDDACKYLGVSKRTLQTYRDKRIIEFVQVGQKVSFTRHQLDEFVATHTIGKRN